MTKRQEIGNESDDVKIRNSFVQLPTPEPYGNEVRPHTQ